jgi:hypothetical protein
MMLFKIIHALGSIAIAAALLLLAGGGGGVQAVLMHNALAVTPQMGW